MIVIYNGKQVDYLDNYDNLVRDLILTKIKHFSFQSLKTIKETTKTLLELLIEGFENEKKIVNKDK